MAHPPNKAFLEARSAPAPSGARLWQGGGLSCGTNQPAPTRPNAPQPALNTRALALSNHQACGPMGGGGGAAALPNQHGHFPIQTRALSICRRVGDWEDAGAWLDEWLRIAGCTVLRRLVERGANQARALSN